MPKHYQPNRYPYQYRLGNYPGNDIARGLKDLCLNGTKVLANGIDLVANGIDRGSGLTILVDDLIDLGAEIVKALLLG
jgi:hypothetical protein